jgi:hypothetical protein
VDVEVKDCLTGRRAAVDADVVAIGSMVLLYDGFDAVHCRHQGSPLLSRCVEPGGHVAMGNQKSVARRHWESVPQPVDQVVAEDDAVGWRVAEEAGCRKGIGDDAVLAGRRSAGIIYEWAGLA